MFCGDCRGRRVAGCGAGPTGGPDHIRLHPPAPVDVLCGWWPSRPGLQHPNRLSTVTDQLGNVGHCTYDEHGQVLTQVNPLGKNRTPTYQPNGDLATITDPSGAVTQYQDDALGQPVVTIDPAGHHFATTNTPWGGTGRPGRRGRVRRRGPVDRFDECDDEKDGNGRCQCRLRHVRARKVRSDITANMPIGRCHRSTCGMSFPRIGGNGAAYEHGTLLPLTQPGRLATALPLSCRARTAPDPRLPEMPFDQMRRCMFVFAEDAAEDPDAVRYPPA